MKVSSLGAELFHADGQARRTDGQKHDEANCRFWKYCERA